MLLCSPTRAPSLLPPAAFVYIQNAGFNVCVLVGFSVCLFVRVMLRQRKPSLLELGTPTDKDIANDSDDFCTCSHVCWTIDKVLTVAAKLATIALFVCVLLITAGFTAIEESTQSTMANTALITSKLKNEPLEAVAILSDWLVEKFPELAPAVEIAIKNTSLTLLLLDNLVAASNMTSRMTRLEFAMDAFSLKVSNFLGLK